MGKFPLSMWGSSPIFAAMEQLISDIEAHCTACGISPQKLLREAINAKWGQWQDWKDGKSSPTMKVVDRLRAFMAASSGACVADHDQALLQIEGDAA
ncbi:hypothetical protein SAMN05421763_11385 [[Luteovulum] sphaeroides subsp. megalophilum]|nr:hypothetical protein SAMN05421763_11385 [[Luteovulum] sphaeroides subsp. megalophilum]